LTTIQPPGAWRRLLQSRIAVGSAAVLLLVMLLAIFGLAIFHSDPETPTPARYAAPSAQHFFGTDVNGRDVFGRVIEGARISLVVGFSGAIISLVVGAGYGMVAGYVGGRADGIMMRLVEILYAIPRLIIIILAVAQYDTALKRAVAPYFHGSLIGYTRVLILILALGLIEWLSMARIVRGQVLSLKSQTFVVAARAIGQSHVRIIMRHLLPNLIGVVIVYLTLTIPAVILDESFLSFLGLGIQPPQASWGTLLSDGAGVINPVKSYWWLLLYPAAIMSVTLLALNFLGDAMRDAFDPRTRGS
jgi:peptide/nickel transport system permease protein/oligopeptide transport system permease protein